MNMDTITLLAALLLLCVLLALLWRARAVYLERAEQEDARELAELMLRAHERNSGVRLDDIDRDQREVDAVMAGYLRARNGEQHER